MSDRPMTPLADMDYLDGYLDFVYTNDDAPDGAWFQMCVDTIAEHWPEEKDAHECFMQYLQWKNPQEKEDGYQESRKEENRKQESGEQESTEENFDAHQETEEG